MAFIDQRIQAKHGNNQIVSINSNEITCIYLDTNRTQASLGWITVGTQDSGMFRSTNNGSSWSPMNNGLKGKSIIKLIGNSENIVTITDSGAFHTTTISNEWIAFPWNFPEPARAISITLTGYVFVSPYGQPLQKSNMPISNIVFYDNPIPLSILLFQNYPNPFNTETSIKYNLSKNSYVKLEVYDVLGNEVAILVDEEQSIGSHKIRISLGELSSGVYFYQITADEFIEAKKMVLLK